MLQSLQETKFDFVLLLQPTQIKFKQQQTKTVL